MDNSFRINFLREINFVPKNSLCFLNSQEFSKIHIKYKIHVILKLTKKQAKYP